MTKLEDLSKEQLIEKIRQMSELNDHMATMLMKAEKELREYQKREEQPLVKKL